MIFHFLDPLTLPGPSTNASISNAQVTLSLKKPHERPNSSYFNDAQKRYTVPQTLARRYNDKLKEQREHDSLMASQVDTT
jgi:hypothetical protein